ncbi:MAG TPA: site-specific integrase [Paucimonas sp.]|nr:site-specific integrase [Paucimonas sp.]
MWAAIVESEMARGVFFSRTEAESTTLGDALERYWREIRSKMRNAERDKYQHQRWLAHPLSKRFLASIHGSNLAQYRDERRAAGKAENTIRIELAYLSQLFEVCRKEWGMDGLANPVRNIRMPSGSRERDRRLKPGEYELLTAELAKSDNPWLLPAFNLAIETSLRQGMLFKLRWEWVNLHARVIDVPPGFRGTGNKAVPAAIPLSTKAVQVLAALPRSLNGAILGCSQNALMCAWKRALKRIGYKAGDLHWHDLRHEAASRLFEKGLHPMEVASITGHRSLNMLRRYTHLQASDLARKLG